MVAAICMNRMMLAQGYLHVKASLLALMGCHHYREDEAEWGSPLQSSLVGYIH